MSNNVDRCFKCCPPRIFKDVMAVTFPEHKQAISLPVKHIIETAFNALKSSTTEPGFYRKQ